MTIATIENKVYLELTKNTPCQYVPIISSPVFSGLSAQMVTNTENVRMWFHDTHLPTLLMQYLKTLLILVWCW